MGPDVRGTKCTGCIVNSVRYYIQQHDELCKSQNCGIVVRGLHEKVEIDFYATQAKQVFYIDDPKLGEDWRIVLKFQARQIYDMPEKKNSNSEVENDELSITNVEVYQDTSLESKSIVNDMVDMLSQLHRDNVKSITIDANLIEFLAQTEYEVEVDYNG
ncbi:hypothetical protein P3L10_002733 [Capsicum annuum]